VKIDLIEFRSTFESLLRHLDYNEIRDLLKFWTGSYTVPRQLYVETTATEGWLPQASTCHNTLKIPRDLIRQSETLLQRVRTALFYGNSGTGFG